MSHIWKLLLAFLILISYPLIFSQATDNVALAQYSDSNVIRLQFENRNFAITFVKEPMIFTSEQSENKTLQIKFFDQKNFSSIKNITFYLNVTKGNQKLMYDSFSTDSGIMKLKFEPRNTMGNWTVTGYRDPILGAWMNHGDLLEIHGPIFIEPGLYHFHVQMLAIGHRVLDYSSAPRFDYYFPVVAVSNSQITYHDAKYNVKLISFTDKTDNFNFNASRLEFSWSIPFPFDWNNTKMHNSRTFVHEKLQIPNSFKEFWDAKSYNISVNNFDLPSKYEFVDSASAGYNNTILHIFFSKLILENITKTTSNNMKFVVYPKTTNESMSNNYINDQSIPEFPLASVILLATIVFVIVFYRLQIKT